MKSLFRVLILACMCCIHMDISAQSKCGTDSVMHHWLGMDSARYQQLAEIEHQIQNHSGTSFNDTLYTIPIVVHVIHTGQAVDVGNNLSDSAIHAGIKGLNERFRAQYPRTTTDMGIQFVLATKSPEGCHTTGITRTLDTDLPLGGFEYSAKSALQWPPGDYYNIYICPDSFLMALGYAYYPTNFESVWDGTMIRKSVWSYHNATPAHELGHAFNLYHTFEQACKNNNCNVDGDKVCDTGPITDKECGSTVVCSDTNYRYNSLKNIMSYCPDDWLFTFGQRQRMRTSISTTIRQYLITSSAFDSVPRFESGMDQISSLCNQSFEVQYQHKGSEVLDSFEVYWQVNSGSVRDSTIRNTLLPCESLTIRLSDKDFIGLDISDSVKIWTGNYNGDSSAVSGDTLVVKQSLRSGNYTVGSDTSDFATIDDAIDFLHEYGICGSVNLLLHDATYTGSWQINTIQGVSENSVVTFKSFNSSNPQVVVKTSAGTTFRLVESEFVGFENITFEADSATSFSSIINLTGRVDDITVRNCRFYSKNPGNYAIRTSSSAQVVDLRILASTFDGISGISLIGKEYSTDITIDSCAFLNVKSTSVWPIYLKNCSRIKIEKNRFLSKDGWIAQNIYISNCIGWIRINRNLFQGRGIGVNLNSITGSTGNNIVVSNNYFVGNERYALYCLNSEHTDIVNNSFKLQSHGYAAHILSSRYMTFFNNAINLDTGLVVIADTLSYIESDNNAYGDVVIDSAYYSGYFTNHICIPLRTELWDRQYPLENNSVITDPIFASDSKPNTCNFQMYRTGYTGKAVHEDFFGKIRKGSAPDIGAAILNGTHSPPSLGEDFHTCDPVYISPNGGQYHRFIWNENFEDWRLYVDSTSVVRLQAFDTICGSRFYDTIEVFIHEGWEYEFVTTPARCGSNSYQLPSYFDSITIHWMNGSNAKSIAVDSTTEISFYWEDSIGCRFYSDTLELQVRALPPVDLGTDTTIHPGDTIYLNAPILDKAQYLWSNQFGTPSIRLIADDMGLGVHTYWVVVVDRYGCIGRDTIEVIVKEPVSSQTRRSERVSIHPNPAHDFLLVDGAGQNATGFQLYSAADGRLILSGNLDRNQEIDIRSVETGLYLVDILLNNHTIRKKVLIYRGD